VIIIGGNRGRRADDDEPANKTPPKRSPEVKKTVEKWFDGRRDAERTNDEDDET
jgi:hypothetical protein